MITLHIYESANDVERYCGRLWVEPRSNEVYCFHKNHRQFLEVYSQAIDAEGMVHKGFICSCEGGDSEDIYVRDSSKCTPMMYENDRYVV